METIDRDKKLKKAKLTLIPLSLIKISIIILTVVSLSSCYEHGFDGMPGNAYLSLNWDYEEPYYLDAGTSDIPAVFEWGAYYLTRPGWYNFYYEGEHWNGYKWMPYAYEVDYEIWINPGEAGGHYYDGHDGMDNFFSILCTPFGPGVYYDGKSYKKSLGESKESITSMKLPEIGEEIKFEQKEQDFGITATFKRVEPRPKK